MKISKELAELIGVILGDGYIHKISDTIVITGSLDDYKYYKNYLLPLAQKLFESKGCIYFQREKGACYFSINSKMAMKIILDIGLKSGKKNYRMPNKIKKRALYPHILRGIFDTDGCLKFSKQSRKVNYYPRIQFALMPSDITNFISIMLEKLEIKHGKWTEDNSRGFQTNSKLVYFHISGTDNLENWMKVIGTHNPVHITKYMIWKKYGHYTPKLTLSQRFNLLGIDTEKSLKSPVV